MCKQKQQTKAFVHKRNKRIYTHHIIMTVRLRTSRNQLIFQMENMSRRGYTHTHDGHKHTPHYEYTITCEQVLGGKWAIDSDGDSNWYCFFPQSVTPQRSLCGVKDFYTKQSAAHLLNVLNRYRLALMLGYYRAKRQVVSESRRLWEWDIICENQLLYQIDCMCEIKKSYVNYSFFN